MNNKLKYNFLALTTLIIIVLVVAALTVHSARAATAYYVDCSAGSNGSGTQASPWNTLTSVNSPTFAAGDQVLFKRGTTCSGALLPKGSGSSGSPITIDAYGTGAAPIISAGTNVQAMKLNNQSYWVIKNVEFAGGTRYGIFITGTSGATLTYFRLTNLVVRNVTGGTVDNKVNGLVVIGEGNSKTNDIIIDNVVARDTTMWQGIMVFGGCCNNTSLRGNNVIIRNSTAYNTMGEGIVIHGVNTATIENSVAHDTGNYGANPPGSPNALWNWDSDNVLNQYNEVYLADSPTYDGGAFDADYYSHNSTYQYNYAHDNAAYCMAVCSYEDNGGSSVNTNIIFRYNICSTNGLSSSLPDTEVFHTWMEGGSSIDGYQIYNNTIYTTRQLFNEVPTWSGTRSRIFKNNLIYSTIANPLGTDPGLTRDYNLWYTTAGSYTGTEPHSIYNQNPLLNDPTYHGVGKPVTSFTLQSGSPAINAGTDVGSMGSRDFFGNAIPNGAYDIGANEYTGGPTNLVVNPGFETGSLSPWGSWNNSVVASNAHTGTYSMQDGTAEGAGEQTISGLSPNTAYVLKGWVKTSATSVTAQVGAKNFGGTDTFVTSTSTTYTQLTVNFTTGASNTSATIYCYKPTTSGYVYCDDFSVEVASSGPTPTRTSTPVGPTPTRTNTPVPTNLVSNPGFETGSWSPWSPYGTYSIVTTNVHSGTRAARLSGIDSGTEQTITVSPNTTYILTGWGKVSASGNTVNIGVKNFGGTNQNQAITSTTYQQKTITFTTGASNTTALIYCWKSAGSNYGYCDDFSVTRQ